MSAVNPVEHCAHTEVSVEVHAEAAGVDAIRHEIRKRCDLCGLVLAEPIHNYGCDEWCNHCQVCGEGALYGSRCHDHPIVGGAQ